MCHTHTFVTLGGKSPGAVTTILSIFETKILEPHASFHTMVKGLVLVRSNAKGLWSVFGAVLSYYANLCGFLLAQQKMTPQAQLRQF